MDNIGQRAVIAIEDMARKNGRKVSKEYQSLDITATVFYAWKRKNFSPSAYYLSKMVLAGYDVPYILTGVK